MCAESLHLYSRFGLSVFVYSYISSPKESIDFYHDYEV
ncbi:hypothetical protein PGTDC60_2092 [Porphyromonas gingivalis TDC60]|nr:hypothetical protein PGTDC60_1146 [Porphyromonas gingivalis TDC60]BAK26233.1 hypothetical protein PGTDC60_2092 [Porphyromonas gingivalis TDC60]